MSSEVADLDLRAQSIVTPVEQVLRPYLPI